MNKFWRKAYMQLTTPSAMFRGNRAYVRGLYALWSKLYVWTIKLDDAYRKNAARMVEMVVSDGAVVLDVGAGTGLLAETCTKIASSYTGADISPHMLAKAIDKAVKGEWSNARFQYADAVNLPFDDQSFDSVISSFMLAHLKDEEKIKALMEMRRVLKPGRRLGLFSTHGEVTTLFSTKDEWLKILDAAGFEEVRIEDCDDIYRIITAVNPAASGSDHQ